MKVSNLNRKQFLHGRFANTRLIRPPWSIDEPLFTDACSRCFECARVCPSQLIIKGEAGYPEMSFIRQGCDYCQACVKACSELALNIKQPVPWHQSVEINDQCFAARAIECRSCADTCEHQALEFKLLRAGQSQVKVNSAACNGCGECVHVCPAHAIKIVKNPDEISQQTNYSENAVLFHQPNNRTSHENLSVETTNE